MKNNLYLRKTLFCILLSCILYLPSQAQFIAEMHNLQPGGKRIYKVTNNGAKYRYDVTEGTESMIVIVDPENKRSSILIPSMQYVHHMELHSMQSLSNDPVQAFNYYVENYEVTLGEGQTVNGFFALPVVVSSGGQKLFTGWFSEELDFPVKIINEQQEGHLMELKNIIIEEIDPTLFDIPDHYTEVDNQMRPIIPEPPPPESWNDLDESVPFEKVFRRGDRIHFLVETEIYHKLILENTTENPAKIIRYQYKDGLALPDNKQGPVDFRTNRLFSGEKKTHPLAWKTGTKIILEIHEGELTVEVKPER